MPDAGIVHPDAPIDAIDSPSLADLLEIERLEHDIFRGWSPNRKQVRVFGGQVAAQALRAAQLTLGDDPQMFAHSLHAYFLRSGDWRHPILYRVDRIRDGRSFATRRVVAIQYGEAIFNLEASFQIDEPGYEHQHGMLDAVELAGVHPDELASDHFAGRVDSRQIDVERIPESHRPARWLWFRVPEFADVDRHLSTAALVYASDHGPVGAAKRPHDSNPQMEKTMAASLDHLVWIHRPTDMSQWHFYALEPSSTHRARGIAHGSIHRIDGTLVASVVQESLIRPWRR